MNNDSKKVVSYLIILILLVLIIICNNLFWKIGKEEIDYENKTINLNNSNVIYDVPYEEIWLEY